MKHSAIKNLILDYDGVIKYKDSSISHKAENLLIDYFMRRMEKGTWVLHLDTMRGMSLFREDLISKLIDLFNEYEKSDIYFTGNAGAFLYDLGRAKIIDKGNSLTVESIDFIINSSHIEQMINMTGQDDLRLWNGWRDFIRDDLLKRCMVSPKLFWDVGYPGSDKVYKCSIDIDEKSTPLVDFIDTEASKMDIPIALDITNSVLEITHRDSDKGSIVRKMYENGYYKSGDILAIGDNPHRADKLLLDALPRKLDNGSRFISMTNNEEALDDPDEKVLYTRLVKILSDEGL